MKIGGALIVGLLLGLVGGLIYTWFVAPIQYYDTYPPMLASRYRQEWVRMTAWTYGMEGNWDRTKTRLLDLPDSEVREGAVKVLDEAVAVGAATEVLQRVARLAAAYGATGPGVSIYTGVSSAPSEAAPSAVPLPTATAISIVPASPAPTSPPAPTATWVPAPPSPFRIISQTLTCEPKPRIAVSLEVSRTIVERGRERSEIVGLPNHYLWLIWDSGADRAITGFRPEVGLGCADFVVEPGHTYNLYIDSPNGLPIFTVQVEPCVASEDGWVSRYLTVRKIETPEPDPDADTSPTETPLATVLATLPLTATETLTTPLAPVRQE